MVLGVLWSLMVRDAEFSLCSVVGFSSWNILAVVARVAWFDLLQ